MRDMNIDLDAIKAGADTYNNMLWNNCIQSSAMDWTTIYNARNFNRIAANIPAHDEIEPFRALDEPAYGEKRDPACHTGPMFNPLHPTVQQAHPPVRDGDWRRIRRLSRLQRHLLQYVCRRYAVVRLDSRRLR